MKSQSICNNNINGYGHRWCVPGKYPMPPGRLTGQAVRVLRGDGTLGELLPQLSYYDSTAGHNVSRVMQDKWDMNGYWVSYDYHYDKMGRLSTATFTCPTILGSYDYSTVYGYDLNSNLTDIKRKGVTSHVGNADYFGYIDNLYLTYNGNQLEKVKDYAPTLTYAGAMDFRDGADETTEYLWDADGRLTRDLNKGIYEVQYNLIGLPSKTHFFNGNIIYTDYAADGRKLQTRYVYDSNEVAVIESDGGDDISGSGDLDELFGSMAAVGGSVAQPDGGLIPGGDLINPEPLPLVQLLGKRDYCGGHIYLNDTIERVLTPVGYYNDLGDHFAYVKDWQGNVRVTIDQNGNVVEAVDYYPYGMVMEKDNEIATDAQPYKYGGKELDRRFGYDSYDFEARVYDPAVGRFTTPDPLAWDTPWLSPYSYCAGDPVNNIDYNGKWVIGINGTKVRYDFDTNKWSRNTPCDVRRIGDAMVTTETGRAVLKRMLETKHPITIKLDTENVLIDETSGETILGNTNTKTYKDRQGKPIKFKSSEITIYLKAIQEAEHNDIRYENLTYDEIIGSNAVHEGTHATDKEASGALSPNKDTEQKAKNVETEHLKQLRDMKSD